MRVIRLLGAAAAVTLVAGCGSTPPPTPGREGSSAEGSSAATVKSSDPPSGPPDPCKLVTDEDAAAAGVAIRLRQLTEHPPSPVVPTERYCILLGEGTRYITVHVSEGGRSDYDKFRDQHDIEYSFRDLPGLGDAAHSITTEVVILIGMYVIRYNLQLFDATVAPATQQDWVIALARASISRIS